MRHNLQSKGNFYVDGCCEKDLEKSDRFGIDGFVLLIETFLYAALEA